MNRKQSQNKGHVTESSVATKRLLAVFSGAVVFVTGCAMCCGPYDYHYPNYGGSVQRSDPVWGRVGSIFSDPGPFGGPSADYNLAPHDSTMAGSSDTDDLDLDNFDDEFESPNNNGSQGSGSSGDVLPPPNNQRPGPDDTTLIERMRNPPQFRNQSQRGQRRWR